MPRKLTFAEFIKKAKRIHGEKYNYQNIHYVNTDTEIEIICPDHGAYWQTPHSHLRGRGCPSCAGNVKKQLADYHALAKERGFRWLGPETPNVTTSTTWRCTEGHQWKAAFHDIRKGIGCPFCSGHNPKTPADYHALAKERGFRWLGPEVSTIKGKTVWECSKGHQWKANYNNIQQGWGSCPECRKITPEVYHALAKERGFRWLGPEVNTTKEKTVWECSQGHRWAALINNIRRGTGCPVCNESKGEKAIADLLDKLEVSYERQYSFRQCLGKKGGRLFFDFAVFLSSDLCLIEYDGEGHYQVIDHWGGEQSFQRATEHDAIKNRFTKKYGISLLRIPYTDFDDIEPIVTDWLNSLLDKKTRMDKPPKGVRKPYKRGNHWLVATQLTLLSDD